MITYLYIGETYETVMKSIVAVTSYKIEIIHGKHSVNVGVWRIGADVFKSEEKYYESWKTNWTRMITKHVI